MNGVMVVSLSVIEVLWWCYEKIQVLDGVILVL